MVRHRMTAAVDQRQNRHFLEVVLRQFNFAVENREKVCALYRLRISLWTVTLQAQRIDVAGPQQVRVRPPVWLVADRTTLLESRLVGMSFLALFRQVRMAGQADGYWIGLQKGRGSSRMRVVADRAITLRAGVLHLRRLDLLGLVRMARDAQ